MKHTIKLVLLFFLVTAIQSVSSQEKTIKLAKNFDKIIVGPHIEATFVQGTDTKIEVQSITTDMNKLQFEIENNTLQVYLEGAKTVTEHTKTKNKGYKQKIPVYKNTIALVTIT